jgi:hypothetical protein
MDSATDKHLPISKRPTALSRTAMLVISAM